MRPGRNGPAGGAPPQPAKSAPDTTMAATASRRRGEGASAMAQPYANEQRQQQAAGKHKGSPDESLEEERFPGDH